MMQSKLEIHESQIEYDHFSRMLASIVNQPEFRPSGGIVVWLLIYYGRKIIWHFDVKKKKPYLFTIELGNKVMGGFTIGQSGEIGNVVISPNKKIKHIVTKILINQINQILSIEDRYYKFRTFDTNQSLISAALRRGFTLSEKIEYVITLPLGPFTFSWISDIVPKWIMIPYRIRVLRKLERRVKFSINHFDRRQSRVRITASKET